MDIECPKCLEKFEVDTAGFKYVIDDYDIQCTACDHEFYVGLVVELEVRDSQLTAPEIPLMGGTRDALSKITIRGSE